MIDVDKKNHPSGQFGKATTVFGTKLGDGLIRDIEIPSGSVQVSCTGKSNAKSLSAAFLFSIREQLEQHPHFRGRTSLIGIELAAGTIVLTGRLPTYYLKQLLQEAIRLMPDVVDIDNRVLVVLPNH